MFRGVFFKTDEASGLDEYSSVGYPLIISSSLDLWTEHFLLETYFRRAYTSLVELSSSWYYLHHHYANSKVWCPIITPSHITY